MSQEDGLCVKEVKVCPIGFTLDSESQICIQNQMIEEENEENPKPELEPEPLPEPTDDES